MKKAVYTLLVCCVGLFTTTCVDDPFNSNEISSDNIQMTLLVKAPKPSTVRAAGAKPDDAMISKLDIHLFDTDNGIYLNTIAIAKDFEKLYNDNEKAYEVKIELPKDNSKIDLVLVANSSIDGPKENATKTDFYDNAIIELKGKWEIKSKKMPFWGEKNSLEIDKNAVANHKNKIEVALIRSLARVDFVVDTPENKNNSDAYKTRIKLKSVYVYRSLDKARLAPLPDNYNKDTHTTVTPTIPNGALNNYDNGAISPEEITIDKEKPLKYKNESGDLYSFKETIYLPEQICNENSGEEALFFVIGALFGADGDITYYRIDLKENGNSGKLLNLLRNHNYIFNIKGAVGPGYETPQKAASQGSSNIEVDVVEWDNGINEGYINGNKYFGINSSDIVFEGYQAKQTHEIKYMTNLPDAEISETIMLEFKNNDNPFFSAELDIVKKSVMVKTIKDNDGQHIVEDSLIIHCISKKFKMAIRQKPKMTDYYLVCDSTKVHGLFQKNVPLNNQNYISVKAESDNNLTGRNYKIFTNKLDGLSFFAEGTFAMTVQPNGKFSQWIDMAGTGTAVTSLKKEFIIIPNTTVYSTCNATLKMAFGPKKIVGFSNGGYGYSTDNYHSKIFREDTGNFGLTDNSVIKVSPLTIFKHHVAGAVSSSTLSMLINSDTIPDIIIWGHDAHPANENADKALINYLTMGGIVFMMCQNGTSNKRFLETLYKTLNKDIDEDKRENITISYGLPTLRYCFPFIFHPSDPIADGPFGSIKGKLWAQDGLDSRSIKGLPEEDLIIYSRSVYTESDNDTYDQGVTIFRHKKCNLIFIGDGGFISQNGSTYTDNTYCHYMINRKSGDNINKEKHSNYEHLPLNFPIPKKFNNGTLVYNSVFFANMLAWAIEEAEYNGINSKNTP